MMPFCNPTLREALWIVWLGLTSRWPVCLVCGR